MAFAEKRAPRYLSIAAMVFAVLLTGWLWKAGNENPRRYVASMTINRHGGYGVPLACHECHVPSGGLLNFATEMNCISSGCHGSLQPGTPPEEALRLAMEAYFIPLPDAEERARHFLAMHLPVKSQSCWECHSEHSIHPPFAPDGWIRYGEAAGEGLSAAGYESILARVP